MNTHEKLRQAMDHAGFRDAFFHCADGSMVVWNGDGASRFEPASAQHIRTAMERLGQQLCGKESVDIFMVPLQVPLAVCLKALPWRPRTVYAKRGRPGRKSAWIVKEDPQGNKVTRLQVVVQPMLCEVFRKDRKKAMEVLGCIVDHCNIRGLDFAAYLSWINHRSGS